MTFAPYSYFMPRNATALGAYGIRNKRRYRKRRFRARNRRYRLPYVRKNNKMKSIIRSQEMKTHDVAINEVVTSAGAVHALTLITQGNTISTREGNTITGMKLYCKYSLSAHTDQTKPSLLRIIVFKDMKQYGTLPVVTNAENPVGVLVTAFHLAHFAPSSRSRFRILYDNMFALGADSGEDDIPYIQAGNFHVNMPKRGSNIFYAGPDADQPAQGRNNIYCLVISNQATEAPNAYLNFRFRFYG